VRQKEHFSPTVVSDQYLTFFHSIIVGVATTHPLVNRGTSSLNGLKTQSKPAIKSKNLEGCGFSFAQKLLQQLQNTLSSLMQNAAGDRSTMAGFSAPHSELARADAALLQKMCACIIQHSA